MNSDTVAEFRRRLQTERVRLARTATTTDRELATLEIHPPGAVTEDAGTELVTTILSRLEGQEKHELDEIAAAQARLEAGTFGVCETCAAPIPLARLRAVPVTRFCVQCQTRMEREGLA